MRVKVLRVSGMPHRTQLWVDSTPDKITFYFDTAAISAGSAHALEAAVQQQFAATVCQSSAG